MLVIVDLVLKVRMGGSIGWLYKHGKANHERLWGKTYQDRSEVLIRDVGELGTVELGNYKLSQSKTVSQQIDHLLDIICISGALAQSAAARALPEV